MAGANVKFYIQGDNASAMRAMAQVDNKIGGLSNSINGNLKGAIASAFAVGAIVAAAKATISYADDIDKVANRLGVTTEYVQILQRVARDTGKEFSSLEKAMINVGDAAESALGGDASKLEAFKRLGITQKDLRTSNNKDLLTKSAQGAQKLPREQAVAAFTSIFGKKEAGTLLGVSDKLANPDAVKQELVDKGQLVSDADIAKMAEMQDAFEDITATLKVGLVPVITNVVNAFTWFIRGIQQAVTVLADAMGYLSTLTPKGIAKVGGAMAMEPGSLKGFGALGLAAEGAKFITKQIVGEDNYNQAKTVVGGDEYQAFGDHMNDVLLGLAADDQRREREQQARRDDRAKKNSTLDGPVNRTGKVTGGDVTPAELKSSPSSFVSIGGIAGVNTQYRIERLNKDMLEQLKQIKQLLQGQDKFQATEDSV